jgi:hypothetical protein
MKSPFDHPLLSVQAGMTTAISQESRGPGAGGTRPGRPAMNTRYEHALASMLRVSPPYGQRAIRTGESPGGCCKPTSFLALWRTEKETARREQTELRRGSPAEIPYRRAKRRRQPSLAADPR